MDIETINEQLLGKGPDNSTFASSTPTKTLIHITIFWYKTNY